MKNAKLQTPNSNESPSTKLQSLARLLGRFKKGARKAMSARYSGSHPRGQSCPRSCSGCFWQPPNACVTRFNVCGFVLLLSFELGNWNFPA